MDFKRLKHSFTKLKEQNQLMTYANVGLVGMLGLSLYVNMQKETVVMNNLNESCLASEVAPSWMSEASHRRIGTYLAGMLGNITPERASYVEKSVLPYAAPTIYQTVNDLIALQLSHLVEEEVTMTFDPEKTFVEDGKTFVTGKGRMTGITGKSQAYVRTYEFIFDVENYTPTFTYMTVYDDVPHDSIWRSKHAKKGNQ